MFEARVDGKDVTRLELKGKPAPDAFLEAARRVGVEPSRAVVVEDAVAGVEAGCAGGFGCVIGVDRGGHAQALREAGADFVVTDMSQVRVEVEPASAWSLVFEGFDPAQEGIREALCTLGNGYFATRGAVAGAAADDIHYPGTYLAGGYNRLRTDLAGRMVENEDLVNFPNWLALEFRIDGEDWFDARTARLLSYHQEFDLRHGMLLRSISFEDGRGRRSTLRERRLISMADMHLGALELALTADNWSAGVTVRSALDGRIVNAGAKLTASSTTSIWNRWQARSSARTACTCWCAPASRIFMSRRRRERGRSLTKSFSRDGDGLSRNRDTSGRNLPSTSSKVRHWCWRSWPLSIPRATTPFRSAGWKRARPLRARAASMP